MLTGYNEAFIIDGKKKDELIEADPKSVEIIRPILRGRDIKRYNYEFADLWLIFIPWHFPLQNDPSITGASKEAENAFKLYYPAVYKHLFSFKTELLNRNKAETGIRYEWYALQRWGANYWEDFDRQKIVCLLLEKLDGKQSSQVRNGRGKNREKYNKGAVSDQRSAIFARPARQV